MRTGNTNEVSNTRAIDWMRKRATSRRCPDEYRRLSTDPSMARIELVRER